MRRRKIRKHRQFRVRGWRWLVLLALLLALWMFIDAQLRPLVHSMADNQARVLVNETVNEAVLAEMESLAADYQDLATIERASDGRVLAISANAVQMNTLKAAISLAVQQQLKKLDEREIGIPIGTLSNSELLHGRGPKVPLHISLAGSVNAEFRSTFTSAGVNQTRHQIYLDISASFYVIIPGYQSTIDVSTDVLAAETVLVGDVPNVFANLNSDNASAIADFSRLAGNE